MTVSERPGSDRRAGSDELRIPFSAACPARLLIIEDSATMRAMIRRTVARDDRIRIVGEAADPVQARDMIKMHNPDVLTLDIEMPRMDGLQFLQRLMRLRPMPVVMISSATPRGSSSAIEALACGAIDCIDKADLATGGHAALMLGDRLVSATMASPQARGAVPPSPLPVPGFRWNGRHVLIGASTGGVEAIGTILSAFPPDGPPVVIAQHMPAAFLERFALRLDRIVAPKVHLAVHGAPIRPGHVCVAPGGRNNLLVAAGLPPVCHLRPISGNTGAMPSIDALFASARPMARQVIAVLLTGMGRDGAARMLELRAAGARCLAQDAASSAVFGMPKAAREIGAAEAMVPIADMARCVLGLCDQERHQLFAAPAE